MKIVQFLGGLGNQMFQYAFYKALQNKYKDVKVDLLSFNDYKLHNGFELDFIFNIKINKANSFVSKLYNPKYRNWTVRKLRRLLNLKKVYFEEKECFIYDENLLAYPSKRFYWGYWQTEKYFKHIEAEIRNDFIFKTPLNKKNELLFEKIKNTTSVAVHIRRGDYVNHPLFGDICDENYYNKAIKHIQLEVKKPTFFIFSNDMVWCKNQLNLPNATYVDWNIGDDSYIDMQLMSYCKHNIIANSSFSWWAAWLNNNGNKIVIAPQMWINNVDNAVIDILPTQWIKI
jgi:hypothetical protein